MFSSIYSAFLKYLLTFAVLLILSSTPQVFAQGSNPITIENAKPGTIGWTYDKMHLETNTASPLVGYANKTSINHGESITFHISTTAPSYSLQVYH